jgi:hypothetical protein
MTFIYMPIDFRLSTGYGKNVRIILLEAIGIYFQTITAVAQGLQEFVYPVLNGILYRSGDFLSSAEYILIAESRGDK